MVLDPGPVNRRTEHSDMLDAAAEAHCSSGVGGCRSTDGQIVALQSRGRLIGELALFRRSKVWRFSWRRSFKVVLGVFVGQ